MAEARTLTPAQAAAEERKWKVEAAADVEPDINVTPLVDISLVLVIIFLVTSPFLIERDIPVQSAKADISKVQIHKSVKLSLQLLVNAKTAGTDAVLVEEILEGGKKRTDKKTYSLNDDLAAAIAAKVSAYEKDQRVLYLEPSNDVLHGDVVRALDMAKQNGVEKLSFVTQEVQAPKEIEE